jgi:hypothetical protein
MIHLLANLLLAASALVGAADCPTGQCPLPPQLAPADFPFDKRPIARIENGAAGARTLGSGTLVDVDGQQGLVVTCAHLFRAGVGAVVVTFPGGTSSSGRVAKLDAASDLAAIVIAAPPIAPVELASQHPQRGDLLVSCGYGGDGRLWCNRGQALGYVSTVGGLGRETLELSGSARQGDSGGPVFDRQGRLAAVLFGTNGRVVDATFCGRVREFLAGLSPRFGGSQVESPAPAIEPGPIKPDSAAPNSAAPDRLQPVPPRIVRPVRPRREKNSPAPGPLDKAADAIGKAAEPWLAAKATALLVSFGLPGGVAAFAGGTIVWFVMRRGKKKLHAELARLQGRSATANDPAATAAAGEAGDSAKKVVERHFNRYVPYEASTLDKAWAAAHARVGEKYPGAIPYLKIVEGVKDQLLSGIEEPQLN